MPTPFPKTVAVTSGGTLVNEVIYPHPCIVHRVHVAHNSGSATWVQVHDASSPPANGAVPIITHSVTANEDATIEGGGGPFRFLNGIYVCESSTIVPKTLVVTPHLFVTLIIEEMTWEDDQ